MAEEYDYDDEDALDLKMFKLHFFWGVRNTYWMRRFHTPCGDPEELLP